MLPRLTSRSAVPALALRGSRCLATASSIEARKQLEMLPEYKELANSIPSGTVLLGLKSHTGTVAKALDLSARLGNIVEGFPSPMKESFAPAVGRRQATVREACCMLPEAKSLLHEGAELQRLRAGAMTATTNQEAAKSTTQALASFLETQPKESSDPEAVTTPASMTEVASILNAVRLQAVASLPYSSSPASSSPAKNGSQSSLPSPSDYFDLAEHLRSRAVTQLTKFSQLPSSASTDPRLFAAIRGACTAAHSSACRNVAAQYLKLAVSSLADVSGADEDEDVAKALSESHQLLTVALDRVNEEIDEARFLKRDHSDHNGNDSNNTAASLLSCVVDRDLAFHAAHLEASLAELGLLSALWAAWSDAATKTTAGGAANGGVHRHEDKEGGVSNGDGGEINSKSAKPASILLLSNEQQHTLAGPMKRSAEHAEASLKRLSQLVPADGRVTRLRFSDYGLDFSGGMARPLRTLALLQLLGRRPVMAEGFLRAALDHHENDLVLRSGSSSNTQQQGQRVSTNNGSFELYPHQLQGTIGLTQFVFAHLLLSWEKREGEGNKVLATSKQLLNRFEAVLLGDKGDKGDKVKEAVDDNARRAFIKGMLLGSAAGSMHVGSTSFALEEWMEDVSAATGTKRA